MQRNMRTRVGLRWVSERPQPRGSDEARLPVAHDDYYSPLQTGSAAISTTDYNSPSTYRGSVGAYTPEQLRLRREEQRLEERRRRRRVRLGSLGALLAAVIALASMFLFTLSTGHKALARFHSRPHSRHRTLSVGSEPADALPFPPNPDDRMPRSGEAPSLYNVSLPCSTGCRPYGAEFGWPIKPFHQEHGLRAGLNELRPRSLHVAVDIQARNGAAVYAVQPGTAQILAATGPNARIKVGNYIYWHITPSVQPGETIEPFKTVIGHVMADYGHLAFSELNAVGAYVNPLRPGGIVLSPYANHAPPEIAKPAVAAGGQVVVAVYSPQTFVQQTTYPTPVLAPAGLAYRLYKPDGEPATSLEWAVRGIELLPWTGRSLIYAPGAGAPGFGCFAKKRVCVPHWVYRVAGGFTPPLPPTLPKGRYRLTIYAWDWADNKTALDTSVRMTAQGWRPIGYFPTVLFTTPGYYSQSALGNPILP